MTHASLGSWWLPLLADWSLRWGAILAALALWFAIRPPRRAAVRHALCLSALAAGVLLPCAPRWGSIELPWPSPVATSDSPPRGMADATTTSTPPLVVPSEVESPTPPLPETPVPRPTAERLSPAPRAITTNVPESPPIDPGRVASMVLMGAWSVVAVFLLLRLACGCLVVARLRRSALGVDGVSRKLLDECRALLGVSRGVDLGVHPGIGSPVVVGGPRPMVLVPADWREWPVARRRACLLHELAHLARFDDWVRLAQEILRAPFFFHPMVHWLTRRLDREREILCDEAAVALGCDPVAYAYLLLDVSRRPSRGILEAHLLHFGLLPSLDRRTLEVRIERLLEDDMLTDRAPHSTSTSRLFALGTLALIAALWAGGPRVTLARAPVKPAEPSARINAPTEAPAEPPRAPSDPSRRPIPSELSGTVLDPEGNPVPDARVVVGSPDPGRSGHEVLRVDEQGRYVWKLPSGVETVFLVAYRPGSAMAVKLAPPQAFQDPRALNFRLGKAEPFSALLVDEAGKPLPMTNLRMMVLAIASESNQRMIIGGGKESTGVTTIFHQIPWSVVGGSPVEKAFSTTTAADGSFTFAEVRPGCGLLLEARDASGKLHRVRPSGRGNDRLRHSLETNGFATSTPGADKRLVAVPAARVSGRVVSTLPDVGVSGLRVSYQECHQPGEFRMSGNFGAEETTDAQGRFAFDGLCEGMINVFVHGDGEGKRWTYRAASDVRLTPGKTTEVSLELIPGIEVEGTVVAQATGQPVAGAQVGVYGPFRPRGGAMTMGRRTDDQGRYRYRLPAGVTYFYVMGPPAGFIRLERDGSSRSVTIPAGVARFEVPSITLASGVAVRGKVIDATDAPVTGAMVVGICEGGICKPFVGVETTSPRGEFSLPHLPGNVVGVGKPARLRIRLPDGSEHEAVSVPAADGSVVVKLPAGTPKPPSVEGPTEVAPDELAGVVVDTDGKPIEGASIDAWTWYPGNEAKTDAKGFFRIGGLGKGERVEVVVSKAGFTPQLSLTQPTGSRDWVIVLDAKTYLEGRVTSPDGKPVAGALIRANRGPKRAEGVTITEIWTEATTNADGSYRMYAQSDIYDIQVRVPGVGVARLQGTPLEANQAKRLDIPLRAGVIFRARIVESLSGKPVSGTRLWHWQHPGVEARSNGAGEMEIRDLLPGPFRFQVEAKGFARWWSEQAISAWSRRHVEPGRNWQRNFDDLDFELAAGMNPVTITVEPAVTIGGRVVDPDGKPVAGATVAPALTGTGNSLTGDTRFSVVTDASGNFQAILPASGDRDYNLMAHDGKYGQWRTWGNGVLPPFRARPGESIQGVELRLTRPAIARGRVTDATGRGIAGRQVRASAADRLENRYYDPTTTTRDDGTYELKFIRPGEHFIQVAPFWLDARQAPASSTRVLTLKPSESRDDVNFQVETK